jgi:hypothetical protein
MRAAAAATGAIGSSSEAGFASHSATPIRDSDGGRVCTRASARSWMHQRPAKGHDRPAGGELAPPLRLRGDSKCTRSRAPRAGGGGVEFNCPRPCDGRVATASRRSPRLRDLFFWGGFERVASRDGGCSAAHRQTPTQGASTRTGRSSSRGLAAGGAVDPGQ